LTHVGLGQRATATQPIEHSAKTIAQAIEHAIPSSSGPKRKSAGGRNLAGQRAPHGRLSNAFNDGTCAAL
ncbi:hypothetical protein, partial [Sphingomonas sp.]|uniref:hypothetical protein n=1 Tax=Sphingomonas sp. TaxID=28214 RepID=UPI0035C7CD48